MRKLAIICLAILIARNGQSQDHFSDQLKKIMTEAANNFMTLRGSVFRVTKTDTSFHSKIVIQGTTENRIETNHWQKADTINKIEMEKSSYFAVIDSVRSNGGASQLKKWKKKVADVVADSYKVEEFVTEWQGLGSISGFRFTKGHIEVSVYRSIHLEPDYCIVYLRVSSK